MGRTIRGSSGTAYGYSDGLLASLAGRGDGTFTSSCCDMVASGWGWSAPASTSAPVWKPPLPGIVLAGYENALDGEIPSLRIVSPWPCR